MAGVNKVILMGNVGTEPTIKNLDGGYRVANYSLATSESYRDKAGNKVESVTWHNLVMWGGLADISQKYVKKGSKIYVEGKIKNRSYDDKDGIKRYLTEILVDELNLVDKKPSEANSAASSPSPADTSSEAATSTGNQNGNQPADDLPF